MAPARRTSKDEEAALRKKIEEMHKKLEAAEEAHSLQSKRNARMKKLRDKWREEDAARGTIDDMLEESMEHIEKQLEDIQLQDDKFERARNRRDARSIKKAKKAYQHRIQAIVPDGKKGHHKSFMLDAVRLEGQLQSEGILQTNADDKDFWSEVMVHHPARSQHTRKAVQKRRLAYMQDCSEQLMFQAPLEAASEQHRPQSVASSCTTMSLSTGSSGRASNAESSELADLASEQGLRDADPSEHSELAEFGSVSEGDSIPAAERQRLSAPLDEIAHGSGRPSLEEDEDDSIVRWHLADPRGHSKPLEIDLEQSSGLPSLKLSDLYWKDHLKANLQRRKPERAIIEKITNVPGLEGKRLATPPPPPKVPIESIGTGLQRVVNARRQQSMYSRKMANQAVRDRIQSSVLDSQNSELEDGWYYLSEVQKVTEQWPKIQSDALAMSPSPPPSMMPPSPPASRQGGGKLATTGMGAYQKIGGVPKIFLNRLAMQWRSGSRNQDRDD